MSVFLSMVIMIFALLCWEYPRFFLIHVYAEQRDASGDSLLSHTQLNKTNRALKDRADRYRDPFVPKSVVRKTMRSPVPKQTLDRHLPSPKQEPVRQNVRVRGIVSSPQGRWAFLEFENGERLIVMVGQVIAASSQVVTRITDQGVTLASLEGKAEGKAQPDRTYLLDN